MGDPCCAPAAAQPPAEATAWAAEAERCQVLAADCDPTLDACCRRDLEEQAVAARLRSRLTLHDRSEGRARLAAAVFGAPPPSQQQDGLDSEEEEGDDGVMAQLRAQRLREMQAAAERAVALQQSGHGAVTDVPESRLLREAGASAAPLVAHLALEGWQWSDELDEHMAMLAARHLGTRFVRTPITPASTLHLRLRSPPGPGLLCFREGLLVGAAGVDRFGAPECLLEEAVDKWLRQHRGLLLAAPAAGSSGRRQAAAGGGSSAAPSCGSSDEDKEEEEGDEWQKPCDVCGRCYPHQHIRSVYATRGSGSDSESDGG